MTTTTDFVPAALDATSWATLEPLFQALRDRDLPDVAALERLILDRSELDAAVSEAGGDLYIEMTCHTDDEDAKAAYLDFVTNVEPPLKAASFELDRKIVECPHARALDAARYEVMLRDLRADVEIFREENIPLQTEDTTLSQQYDELCGAMTVTFRGTEHTLPQMAKYLQETDRAVREEAWRLVSARRFDDHERLSDIFDRMIALRHRIARNAGFETYRDYMFKAKHRFDYTPADCETFHQAVEEVCVPLHRALNEERRLALGLDTLRPWDTDVDVKGRDPLRPFHDVDTLIEGTSRVFHRMDPEFGTMFDELRDGTSLDLESRKGKAPGGYQHMRDRSRRPFIFMNATGLQADLNTMIHEAGHAFHSQFCRTDPLLAYRHAPIEFAEVASMSMELITQPFLDEFYETADAARAVRERLEALARLLPWIATIDAFQHWLYTHPTHTRDERRTQWESLVDRFGAALDWSGLEDVRAVGWQRQLHLFAVPFYYIEYGIAQLGALGLWLQSKQDRGRALANYRQAMSLGGSRPLPELFRAAGLDFDFGPATIRRLMAAVQQELAALPA